MRATWNKEKKREYDRRYNLKNKERKKKLKKEYYLTNRETIKIKSAEYYLNHKEEHKERGKKHYLKNRELRREQHRQYRLNNKESIRAYYLRTREQRLKQMKEYNLKNREKKRKYTKEYYAKNKEKKQYYYRHRFQTNPNFRLRCNLASRLRMALKSGSKTTSTMKLIGCTMAELWIHLESKFEPWMTRENYGRGGWDVDHIKACAKFDLTDPAQQRECFHWSNLQPMEHIANIKKGAG